MPVETKKPKSGLSAMLSEQSSSAPNVASDKKFIAESSIKLRGKSKWITQREEQKSIKRVRYSPKIMIYGDAGTGKTHIATSAFQQPQFEGKNQFITSFSPVYFIDCNRSAGLIASKDFPEEYKEGKIIVIDPYITKVTISIEEAEEKYKDIGYDVVDEDGTKKAIVSVPIKNKLARFESVRSLIKDAMFFSTGCLVIDGFNYIEDDAEDFIYQKYDLYERPDGTVWKRGEDGKPEKQFSSFVPLMYGPRNNAMRDILQDLSRLSIPTILTAHPKEKYQNNKPTGEISPNTMGDIEKDMDGVFYLEKFNKTTTVKINGTDVVKSSPMRRLTVKKNRFQKGKAPDMRIIEKEAFEFKDIFDIMSEGI